MNNINKKWLIGLIAIILVIIAGVVIYYIYNSKTAVSELEKSGGIEKVSLYNGNLYYHELKEAKLTFYKKEGNNKKILWTKDGVTGTGLVSWSPDHTQVLVSISEEQASDDKYISNDAPISEGLYLLAPDGKIQRLASYTDSYSFIDNQSFILNMSNQFLPEFYDKFLVFNTQEPDKAITSINYQTAGGFFAVKDKENVFFISSSPNHEWKADKISKINTTQGKVEDFISEENIITISYYPNDPNHLYATKDEKGQYNLYSYDLATKKGTKLTDNSDTRKVLLSKDKTYAFVRNNNKEIYEFNSLKNGKVKLIGDIKEKDEKYFKDVKDIYSLNDNEIIYLSGGSLYLYKIRF
jgi:uncharacterized protein YxeA